MTFRPVITCLLLVSLTNCNQKQPDTRQVAIDAMKSDQAQWLKDFQSRDVDKIVSHFSEDAIVVDKGGPPIRGREQAKRLYRGSPPIRPVLLHLLPCRSKLRVPAI